MACRQREAARGAAEEADDPVDEFDDEETFLNLDDVLEGAASIGGSEPANLVWTTVWALTLTLDIALSGLGAFVRHKRHENSWGDVM